MSKLPYPTYNPHHGRPCIVVHDHDVLCGRGVNIAQHPGNERFRALVSTRYDESYCTVYTTTEKRALAEEIIKHITSLDPPGRFLRRAGRSQGSRGLSGPWEELSPRECVKKTCQALRDCNRNDRQGYASQVSIPSDVRENAERRSASGLTPREYAAAAAAKASSSLEDSHIPTSILSGPLPATASAALKRTSSDLSPDSHENPSPTPGNASESNREAKQRRSNESPHIAHSSASLSTRGNPSPSLVPPSTTSSAPSLAPASTSSTNSTPATYHPYHHMAYHHYRNPNISSIIVPQLASPAVYTSPVSAFHHQDPHVMAGSAFVDQMSPAGLFAPAVTEASRCEGDLGEHPHHPAMGMPPSQSSPQCWEMQPIQSTARTAVHPQDQHHHFQDVSLPIDAVQTAADVAAALASSPSHSIGFSMLSPDDVQQGSLGIEDL